MFTKTFLKKGDYDGKEEKFKGIKRNTEEG